MKSLTEDTFLARCLAWLARTVLGHRRLFVYLQAALFVLSIFYTVTLAFLAAAPPASGFVGDLIGIPGAVIVVAVLTAATLPFAFLIRFAPTPV